MMSNTYSIENELKLIISTTFGLILNDTIRNEERSLLPNVPTNATVLSVFLRSQKKQYFQADTTIPLSQFNLQYKNKDASWSAEVSGKGWGG